MTRIASKSEAPVILGHQTMAALDNQMLAHASPQHSPIKERRESMPDSSMAFSHHNAAWTGYPFAVEHPASDGTDTSMHPFFGATTGAVMPPNSAVQSASFSPQSGWPMNDDSGSCTPTPGFDQLVFPSQQPPSGDPSNHPFNPVQIHTQQLAPGAPFSSTSPEAGKEQWYSAMSSDAMEFRPLTNNKSQTPAFATSTHILRRDGIRKKNARFEIPAERNLRTIDLLINQTTDEQEVKELKQQKRLLRNRQAALDSRQRKKQHTERLEEEKKHYTSMINELEEELQECKAQAAEYIRVKEQWAFAQQQYHEHIDMLRIEKEELVRQHTIETGELRKRAAVMTEQLQRLESTAMSTAPSSAGFSADFSEFDGLTMHSWDDFSISNDFSLEHDQHEATTSLMSQKKDQQIARNGEDKNVTSSLLLMLLLCGAWVVSRGPNASTEVLPAASDEMKSASAAVLNDLYRDTGIRLGSDNAAQSSSDRRSSAVSRSSLDSLHRRLTQPTDQQLHDQAFSITPTQYNELHTGIGQYAPRSSAYETGIGAPTVGQILSAQPLASETTIRGGSGAAETYTRSVLKGRVSADVLKEFARMVTATKQSPMLRQQHHIKPDPVD